MYSQIPSAFLLTQLLLRHGITDIVISPGSRNAPLIIGFTEHEGFNCHSIVDERSAGFYALGIAQATARPVVLVCTSGSAVLNYFPAVAEAYYSEIPLLVISTDRPSYLVDIGDGQTIRQEGVFSTMVGYSASLLQDRTHAESVYLKYGDRSISQEVIISTNAERIERAILSCITKRVPAHLNIPFEEPLYEKSQTPLFDISKLALKEKTELVDNTNSNETDLIRLLEERFGYPIKIMLLIGSWQPTDNEKECIDRIASSYPVLILHESLSKLHGLNAIDSIDTLLAPLEQKSTAKDWLDRLKPDLLLSVGGMVVSKKIKTLLRTSSDLVHIHLGDQTALNTYFSLKGRWSFNELFASLERIQADKTYKSFWLDYFNSLKLKREAYIKEAAFSDFSVFATIFSVIPSEYIIQMGNSSTVRYAQLFPTSNLQFCNRGTSGIEGSLSTAVGYTLGSSLPVLAILGDLSFFYDSNALWNTHIPSTFRVIVINNWGGGIFRILPGKNNAATFTKYFETRHEKTAEQHATHFGFEYLRADSKYTLETVLSDFFSAGQCPKLLEIQTSAEINDQVLLDYFKSLS